MDGFVVSRVWYAWIIIFALSCKSAKVRQEGANKKGRPRCQWTAVLDQTFCVAKR